MRLIYKFQEGGSVTKEMVNRNKSKENNIVAKGTRSNSESTSVSKPLVKSLKVLAIEKMMRDEKEQPVISQGKKLTEQEQKTSNKINKRLDNKKKWENTVVGDLGIDPSDIGTTVGNMASKLTRFSPISQDEIIKTTNNPKETVLLASNLFTNALVNEMAGVLINKGINKLIPKAKIKTDDEVESLIKEIEDTKPIATKYKINDPNINKNNGIIDKPKDPNYLNDFGLRFVDDTKFKDTDGLKILAEHGKQKLITKPELVTKRQAIMDEYLKNLWDLEHVEQAKLMSDLDVSNDWGLNMFKAAEGHLKKNNVSLKELQNRVKELKEGDKHNYNYITTHFGRGADRDLAQSYKERNHTASGTTPENYAIDMEDIQLSPEEIEAFKKNASKEDLKILKENFNKKYTGKDAFQSVKLNEKGGKLLYK